MSKCSRCGRCCTEFATQIHFQSGEPFLLLSEEEIASLSPIMGPIYYEIKDKYKKEIEGKIWYYIPTKSQIMPLMTPEMIQQVDFLNHNKDECMFLQWTDKTETSRKLPYCIIHSNHPEMCNAYPTSKGGACLNHPERKYTRDFLEYQREKIGLAVQVLKQIYGPNIKYSDPVGFEILTLLMDFGRFNKPLLEKFIEREFEISSDVFGNVLEELFDLNLISIYEDGIEGISVKEVDQAVTQIMQVNGW